MRERNGAVELGLIVASVAILVRFTDRDPALAITGLLALAAAAGTANLIGDWGPWREPLIPLALPALAVYDVAGLARVVTLMPWLAVVLVIGIAVVAWTTNLELIGFARQVVKGGATEPSEAEPHPADADSPEATSSEQASATPADSTAAATGGAQPQETSLAQETAVFTASMPAAVPRPVVKIRTRRRPESELPELVVEELESAEPAEPVHPRGLAVRSAALGLAFAGFVATAGFVPGLLASGPKPLSRDDLLVSALLNGGVAALVGYRLAGLIAPHRFDRVVRMLAVFQYGLPVGIGTWFLRTLSLPLLYIPALLTLLVYIITILRESPEPIAINRRLLQELAILAIVAGVAVMWGIVMR